MHPFQTSGEKPSPESPLQAPQSELRSVTGREPIKPFPASPQDHGMSYPVASPVGPPPLPPAMPTPTRLAQPEPGLPHLMTPGGIPLQPVCRWKKHVVLDRFGPPLPTDRCFCCNAPADTTLRKSFVAQGSSLIIIGVLAPLLLIILLPLYFLGPNRASVEFGICTACRQKRLLKISLATGVILLAIGSTIAAFNNEDYALTLLGLVGFVVSVLITAAIVPIARVPRLNGRWIHLKGGCRDFNASFPESDIPQF